MRCKHKNKKKGFFKDNLTGEFYEWECMDCGFKQREGRSYAHKEICECAQTLKKYAKQGNLNQSLCCLGLLQKMIFDAMHRLTDPAKGKKYFEEVF